MAKFKVGDRVRVVKGRHSGAEGFVVGVLDTRGRSQIYEITSPDIVCSLACFVENYLELIQANAYPMPGLDFEREEKAPTEAAPCLNLELAPYPCSCEMRELLMHGCKCGGY